MLLKIYPRPANFKNFFIPLNQFQHQEIAFYRTSWKVLFSNQLNFDNLLSHSHVRQNLSLKKIFFLQFSLVKKKIYFFPRPYKQIRYTSLSLALLWHVNRNFDLQWLIFVFIRCNWNFRASYSCPIVTLLWLSMNRGTESNQAWIIQIYLLKKSSSTGREGVCAVWTKSHLLLSFFPGLSSKRLSRTIHDTAFVVNGNLKMRFLSLTSWIALHTCNRFLSLTDTHGRNIRLIFF